MADGKTIYFVDGAGKSHGPMTISELKRFWDGGYINVGTHVFTSDGSLAAWTPLGKVPKLLGAVQAGGMQLGVAVKKEAAVIATRPKRDSLAREAEAEAARQQWDASHAGQNLALETGRWEHKAQAAQADEKRAKGLRKVAELEERHLDEKLMAAEAKLAMSRDALDRLSSGTLLKSEQSRSTFGSSSDPRTLRRPPAHILRFTPV